MPDTLGHNNPPSDESVFVDELTARHSDLLARRHQLMDAGERVPETVESAEIAGKVADFIKQLTAHEKAADRARTEEKAPYLTRGKWTDAWFKGPAVDGIAALKKRVTDRLTAYQRRVAEEERRRREEEERRQREEARRAAEEAERQRREAEEAAKAAETEEGLEAALQREADAVDAERRMQEKTAAVERAERATQAGAADLSRQHSASGTVASLRSEWKCTGFDRAALDLESLRLYLTDAHIEQAIRAFIRKGGRELGGASIEEVQTSRVA